MKKFLMGFLVLGCFLLSGCGKQSEADIVKELSKKIEKANSYYLEGTMEIINNEDTYTYDVEVAYKTGDFYKVKLKNMANNHEQVILRNENGIYVITPSLNKSFKFQSDWPYNNSQSYLLGSLINDLRNDNDKTFEETKDGYVFTMKVNYPNNSKLVKQIMTLDKDLNIKEVEVLDNNNNVEIKMTFDKIDLKSEFKDDYFDLNKIVEEKPEEKEETITKETATIDDIIYPMYLPQNTYLTNQEKVTKDEGERLILTFDGDSPFMLIEETVKKEDDHIIVPTYGDLEFLASTIAVVSDNSVNWVDNKIEYYVVSDVLSKKELLDIARSISVIPVSK